MSDHGSGSYASQLFLFNPSVLMLNDCQLAFVVPLAAQPSQCYDIITPNDMHTDMTCAWSGSFVAFGGWSGVMWVFLRSLSLHLQIVWERTLSQKFFYLSLLVGWGVPAVILAVTLSLTGFSYRFGQTCHVNHHLGIQDFWGPLLAFCGASAILQIASLIYCVKVYLKSLMEDSPTTETSALPSYTNSARSVTARQTYRRVRRVIQMQWRGLAIVLIIIADVTFFSIVFLKMDNSSKHSTSNMEKAVPWLECLIMTKGNKNKCMSKASDLMINEATLIAVLVLLSTNGIFNLVLLGQRSMLNGWIEFFKEKFARRQKEFVSVDARRLSNDPRTYEMLTTPMPLMNLNTNVKSSAHLVSDSTDSGKGISFSPATNSEVSNDYFSQDRKYTSPQGHQSEAFRVHSRLPWLQCVIMFRPTVSPPRIHLGDSTILLQYAVHLMLTNQDHKSMTTTGIQWHRTQAPEFDVISPFGTEVDLLQDGT
ncbi:MAG: hypothetical protein M1834_001695 [Cirrosporium novae-zelandiae]|nr:MAG: hypothetical protein M1834_001695 [Cirrosporium novae-zelandiae]